MTEYHLKMHKGDSDAVNYTRRRLRLHNDGEEEGELHDFIVSISDLHGSRILRHKRGELPTPLVTYVDNYLILYITQLFQTK